MMFVRALLASTAVAAMSLPASATTLTFNLSGPETLTWQAPQSPTPFFSIPDVFFALDKTTVTAPAVTIFANLTFPTLQSGGGFCLAAVVADCSVFGLVGPQLFSGTTASPTFLTGTFNLNEVGRTERYVLTIRNSGAIPEPASWAMLIAGFGLVGAVRRRRGATVAA